MADDARTGDTGSSSAPSGSSAGSSSKKTPRTSKGSPSGKTFTPGTPTTAGESSDSARPQGSSADSAVPSSWSVSPAAPPLTAAQLAAQADSETSSPSTDTKIASPTAGGVAESRPLADGSDASTADGGRSDEERRSTARSLTSMGGKAAKATSSGGRKTSDAIRTWVASLLWLLAVLAAIVLAVGAFIYAIEANMQNELVRNVLQIANAIDGPFSRIFEFTNDTKGPGEPHDKVQEHLVNWGLAAVAYLIAGRILDRVIRP